MTTLYKGLNKVEVKVLKVVRSSKEPIEPDELLDLLKDVDGAEYAMRSLVDQGKLEVTRDWKLRVKD